VRLTWTGTQSGAFAGIAPTHREVEVNGMSVFALREGKIAEHWIEQDILALHQQLGAAPGHTDNWPRIAQR
jgi:predicted ester cyclase